MDSLSPNIFVKDIRATLEFYKLLGFHVVMSVPEEGQGEWVWAMAVCGKVTIMFQTFQSLEDAPAPIKEHFSAFLPGNSASSPCAPFHPGLAGSGNSTSPLLLYIKVNNIQELYEQIRHKVTIIHGPEKTFYGANEFSILDNNNFLLTFADDEAD